MIRHFGRAERQRQIKGHMLCFFHLWMLIFLNDRSPDMTDSTSDVFQQRRALDLALDALGKTSTEAELVQGAYAIADGFPMALALAALLKRLDTPSSQLRGGLARLATFLPEAEIVAALQEYAGDQKNPPQGRVTAAMISERFLSRPLRAGTLSDLQGNEDAAVQSLHDAVFEGEEDIQILVEYLTQLQAHSAGIAAQVMHHLDNMEPELRVNLLMLVATDSRPQVARSALQRLEAIAEHADPAWPQDSPNNPQRRALRALHVLIPNLPEALASSAERVLRKAQFRGMAYAPPPEEVRCYLGMAHFSSAYSLEFWKMGEKPGLGKNWLSERLAMLVQGDAGFAMCDFRLDHVPLAYRKRGAERALERKYSGGESTWHVEMPAAAGRWLLQRELAWIVNDGVGSAPSEGATTALPHDYLRALVWLWDAPRTAPDPAWVALVEGERAPVSLERARETARRLLALPAMVHWDMIDAVLTGPQRNLYRGKLREEIAPIFFTQIASSEMQEILLARLQEATRIAALWLHFAGDQSLADASADLAAAMGSWSPEENPLLQEMLGL